MAAKVDLEKCTACGNCKEVCPVDAITVNEKAKIDADTSVDCGTCVGALAGMFTDVGIDDDFIKSVQDRVTEGTSALFLLTSHVIVDRVIPAMKGLDFELIASNLSREPEQKLRLSFGEAE